MKQILGVSKNNFIIYLFGFIVSIILCGIYFLDDSCKWCILSCSIGASLIGAVLLAYFIDLSDSKKVKQQNEKTFIVSNKDIFLHIDSFFIDVDYLIHSIYISENKRFEYENKNIEELISLFLEEIKKIEKELIPNRVAEKDGTFTTYLDEDFIKTTERIEKIIKTNYPMIKLCRKELLKDQENFNNYKHVLIANEICLNEDIEKIEALLRNFCISHSAGPCINEELSEIQSILENIISFNLIDILNKIGFKNKKYTNMIKNKGKSNEI